MATALTRFSHWLWRTNKTNTNNSRGKSSNDPTNPDVTSSLREMDSVKFPHHHHHRSRPRSNAKKWRGREERRIDREYDTVIVPSDGGCVSGSESDVSDVSIAFMEPHGPDFMSEDGSDGSTGFAVLVPCYRHDRAEQAGSAAHRFLAASDDGDSSDGKNFVEQWLSSLQN